jgi:hypothetical protein
LAAYPTEFYLHEGRLEEWMIYRFIVCSLLGTAGFVLLAAGTIAHKIVVSSSKGHAARFWPNLFEGIFSGWPLAIFVTASLTISICLVWPGIIEYLTTRHVTLHWSRVMVAAFGILIAFVACVTAVLLQVIAVRQRQTAETEWKVEPAPIEEANADGSVLVANH